jgi:hypothetical protein
LSKDQKSEPSTQLFLDSRIGVELPRDLEAEQLGAVPIVERYVHLSNVLDMADEVLALDRLARLYPLPKNAGRDFVPTKQQAISRNAAKAAEQMRQNSRLEFFQAYGVNALIASGVSSPEDIEKGASKNYDRFTMKFAGRHRFDARQKAGKAWKNLLSQHLHIQDETAEPETTSGNQEAIVEHEGLSTREKLLILAEADNAGFLPTTNEEKNMAATYLDYIRNEDYELGSQSQLVEVATFHGKHHSFSTAKKYAMEASASIAHEFGDWFIQSSQQLADLKEVNELLTETVNPDLSLAVALNVDMLKAIPLIRFMDLVELRSEGRVEYQTEYGVIKPPFSLLRTRSNRSSEDLQPGKNKAVEDPYTGERTKAVTDWLKTRMAQIKVRDVRQLIIEAIEDQEKRVGFHRLVLEDLATEKTDSSLLKQASKVAKKILDDES